MRTNFRILYAGLVWAAMDASILVASIIVLGNNSVGGQESDSLLSGLNLVFTPYTIWPLPSLPIGIFLMLPATGTGFVLSNIEETMKALPLATTLAVLSGLLTVYFFSIPFPDVTVQGYAQAAFFGTVALPLFLIGLVGGIFGTIAGVIVISFVKGKPW